MIRASNYDAIVGGSLLRTMGSCHDQPCTAFMRSRSSKLHEGLTITENVKGKISLHTSERVNMKAVHHKITFRRYSSPSFRQLFSLPHGQVGSRPQQQVPHQLKALVQSVSVWLYKQTSYIHVSFSSHP